jgi:hypothetical protein
MLPLSRVDQRLIVDLVDRELVDSVVTRSSCKVGMATVPDASSAAALP